MKQQKNILAMLSFILKYVSSKKYLLIISIIALILKSFFELLIPQITKNIIDSIIPSGMTEKLVNYIIALIISASLLCLFNYIALFATSFVAQTAVINLRMALYEHIFKQDFVYFESQKIGDTMTKFTSDIKSLQDLVSPNTLGVLGNIFTFFLILLYMLYKDTKIMLFISLTFPLILMLNRYFGAKIRTAYRNVRASSGKMNNQLQTSLNSILLVKIFNAEKFEKNIYKTLADETKMNHIKATKLHSIFDSSTEFVNYIGMALILSYSALEAIKGNLTIGEVVTYLAYLKLVQTPIKSFSQMLSRFQQALVAFERVTEVFEIEPKIIDDKYAKETVNFKENIYFNNVSFSYDNGLTVLKNISFSLKEGKTTAIVGSSGSGKTTITKLLARLYEPLEGEILIGKENINNMKLTILRQNLAIVSQDTELKDGTIRDNISYGLPKAGFEDIEESAKKAKIYDFIKSLPEEYDTEVGEKGIKLSGGQKQRIAIARVFLKNANIIVLDEATASLDNESEKYVQESLENLTNKKTTLIIAHRLSTIKNADEIIVLEQGKIIEKGTHESLIHKNGRYKELYNAHV